MNSNTSSWSMLHYENKARERFDLVIGVDEAGRGPLAGPVVAASVALREDHFDNKVGDSKQLTSDEREKAFHEIFAKAYVGIGIINETVIDTHNILKATFMAMGNAVQQLIEKLPESPLPSFSAKEHTPARAVSAATILEKRVNSDDFWAGRTPLKSQRSTVCLLIDGNRFETELPYDYETIVDGDCLSLSIACASIIAKVTRDRILKIYHNIFPLYGFDQHKGYATIQHREAIKKYGLSSIHRKSFQCRDIDESSL